MVFLSQLPTTFNVQNVHLSPAHKL